MAKNLLAAGHAVVVFDLSETACEQMQSAGAAVATSAAEAAMGRDYVISMLPAGKHVAATYLGDDGLLSKLDSTTTILDCSTIDAATAQALMIYGLGLPAFVLQKVLQPVYFARENTKTPFYYALVSMVVNAGIAIGLAPVIGYLAAAFGTTLAGWAMVALLWRGTTRMGEQTRFDDRFWRRIWRIGIASWSMGAVLWLVALALGPMFTTPGWRALALVLLVGLGAASYFAIGHLIHAFRLSDFRSAMKR